MVLPLIGGLVARSGGRAAIGKALGGGKKGGGAFPPVNIEMSVKAEVKEATRYLTRVQRKQLPFATARALTWTAQAAQKEIQEEIPQRFKVTKKWWLKQQPTGIKIAPATKQKLEASVFTRAHFARLQEDGGTKRPFKSSKIAVPSDNVKAKKNRRSGAVREQSAKPKVFYANTKSGNRALFERKSKNRVKLLYTFTSTARVFKRFRFVETGERAVRENFNKLFNSSLAKALRTARR